MNGGPHCRLSSPDGGGSTFTTCAPMSARSMVQTGPDRIRDKSTTTRSSSGFTRPAYQVSRQRIEVLAVNFLSRNKMFLLRTTYGYNTRQSRHSEVGSRI